MDRPSPGRSTLSECSSDQDISSEELHIKKFAKHMLKGKIFTGTYKEKRYVVELKEYRDVVMINDNEADLIRDLGVVTRRVRGYYKERWIGISTPETIGAPVGHCLWVELEQEVVGSFWYKIKGVRFRGKEIILQLRQVRPIEEVKQSIKESEKKLNMVKTKEETIGMIWMKIIDILQLVSGVMSPHNIKEAIVFLSVLTIAIITGMIQLMKYVLDFSLKLMREISILTHTVTPFAISVVHMFEKIIGGFYILLAMVWRDWRTPQQHHKPMPNNMITYKTNRQEGRRPLIIQEIDY